MVGSQPAIPCKTTRSTALYETKLYLLQLILQKVFGLTLEFSGSVVSERMVCETALG
jgi:hypothetical protein